MTTDDTDLEREMSFSHYGGKAGGIEEVARELRSEAGALFANDRDALAKYIRDELIPKLEARAKQARRTQAEYKRPRKGLTVAHFAEIVIAHQLACQFAARQRRWRPVFEPHVLPPIGKDDGPIPRIRMVELFPNVNTAA